MGCGRLVTKVFGYLSSSHCMRDGHREPKRCFTNGVLCHLLLSIADELLRTYHNRHFQGSRVQHLISVSIITYDPPPTQIHECPDVFDVDLSDDHDVRRAELSKMPRATRSLVIIVLYPGSNQPSDKMMRRTHSQYTFPIIKLFPGDARPTS